MQANTAGKHSANSPAKVRPLTPNLPDRRNDIKVLKAKTCSPVNALGIIDDR